MAEHHIETAIEIQASAARVWTILTDFARMPSWNPFITSIAGTAASGARLTVTIAPPGKSAMQFKPTIIAVRPERELRWLGRLLIPGLFDGEHYFLLDPLAEGRVRFTHGERFSGLLVGLVRGTLAATETGFNAMNAALKREAERK
jgi:hypothetical protein